MEKKYDSLKDDVKTINESKYNLDSFVELIEFCEPSHLANQIKQAFFDLSLEITKEENIKQGAIPIGINDTLHYLRELHECFESMTKEAGKGRVKLSID